MKCEKVEMFVNEISSTRCKWSSFNAPGYETPVSHSLSEESILSDNMTIETGFAPDPRKKLIAFSRVP